MFEQQPPRYNRYFDEQTNQWVDKLVQRSDKGKKPRINKKNGESAFSMHWHFILEKIGQGKKPSQVLQILRTKFGVEQNKSNFYRFLKKKGIR